MSKHETAAKNQPKVNKYRFSQLQQAVANSLSAVLTKFEENCRFLEAQLTRFGAKKESYKQLFSSYADVWVNWLQYEIDKYEKDRFSGIDHPYIIDPNQLYKLENIDEIWKSYDLFEDIREIVWKIRFTQEAKDKIQVWNDKKKKALLRTLLEFGAGLIIPGNNCRVTKEGPYTCMVFISAILPNYNEILLLATELDRLPIVRENSVVQYEFHHYLKVIDICRSTLWVEAGIENYLLSISDDEDRNIAYEANSENNQWYPSFDNSTRKVGDLHYPKLFPKMYLSQGEIDNIIFDPAIRRWIGSKEAPIVANINTNNQRQEKILRMLAQTTSCNDFINLLNTIPNFRIKLTEEQQDLIGTPGNVLAIGRSGTGKTTCSVLRLFSAEVVFRYRSQSKSRKLGPEDLDRSSELHSVFVTASPVLTNEVKRFHEKLNLHLKEELKHKEEILKQKSEFEEIKLEHQESEVKIEENEEIDEAEISGPSSMAFLKDEDFPLFVTVRRLIFMIDATLRKPFFSRDLKGNVIGSSVNFQWHNEFKGALQISNVYKNERKAQEGLQFSDSSDEEGYIVDESALDAKRDEILNTPPVFVDKKRPYEIDFKIFKEKFWPRIKHQTTHSALVMWTEISAYIKGSANSFTYPGYYMPKDLYSKSERKASILTVEEKCKIWDLFIIYERWKVEQNAYDFQDVINYILSCIRLTGYQGIPIHYMMVDEVQDLTPATLYLLIQVTQQKLFFSGDTAQTIAKGVGFRFCELSRLFKESHLVLPTIKQLTVNFRSHNQILELANSVISLLETLFPQTIDKMDKERSLTDGHKPILVDSGSTSVLLSLLLGEHKLHSQGEVLFGCDQVIIVRNQETKEKLHPLLQHALCLTVYESKGLEFEDVILYNFFTDSEVSRDKWKILSNMEKFEENNSYKVNSFEELEEGVPKLKCSTYIDQSKLAMLCTELKHLYVAITRPKSRLVIYDENPDARFYMQKFWEYMGALNRDDIIIGENLTESNTDITKIAKKTDPESWKYQGLRMMSHKFYDQAAKCFAASGDKALEMKAIAYANANQATELLTEADELENPIQGTGDKRANKKKIIENRNVAKELFAKAGDIFSDLALEEKGENSQFLKKQAARCYASAQKNLKAAQLFKESGLLGQAAEAYLSAGKYETAADMFNEKKEYIRAIQCYRHARKWDKLVHCIYKSKDSMTKEERQKYIYKYVPVALEDLMPKILPTVEKETKFINEIIEEDKDELIEEENEETTIEESKEEEKIEEKEKETIKMAESTIEIPQEKSLVLLADDSQSQSSFYLLDKSSSDSFSLLSSDCNNEQLKEALADVDPEDEWLQIETGSIVESLSSAINKDGSLLSDYSIIENTHAAALNLGGKLINTRADIYVEDEAMRKIIEYISMFSEDVGTYLKSLRSAESLLSSQQLSEEWQLASLVDLDEISPELLGLLLDTLEEFGLYKMCLVVCNRYNLSERLGRYIISIGFKFSNISSIYPLEIKKPGFDVAQAHRAVIAYTGVHNVFEMINPEYLNLKQSLDRKNIGIEAFQGLLLMGYWKKTIYIMDQENSLAVASAFADFKNYKHIYLAFEKSSDEIIEKISNEDFSWLPFGVPQSKGEVKAAQIALDSVLWNLNAIYPVTLNHAYIHSEKTIVPKFPGYFVYNSQLYSFISHKSHKKQFQSYLKDLFNETKQIFNKDFFKDNNSDIKSWDILSCYTQLIYFRSNPQIEIEFKTMSYNNFQEFLRSISMIINFLQFSSSPLSANPYFTKIIFGLLSPLGVRQISESPVTRSLPYLSHAIIHKASNLFNDGFTFGVDETYVADVEGQFLLFPISELQKKLVREYINAINHLVNLRYQANKNSTKVLDLANLYGEAFMRDFINSQLTSRPYTFTKVSTDHYSLSGEERRYVENKKQLKKILAMGEDDKHMLDFIKARYKGNIKFLQKEIDNYERWRNRVGIEDKDELFTKMLENAKHMYFNFPKITEISKHALFTQAQVLIKVSEVLEDSFNVDRSIFNAYTLCKLSGNMIYFQEMLKARYKTIVNDGRKGAKISYDYKYALTYLDIDVYNQYNCPDEIAKSICSLFEAQYSNIDISRKIMLIERAVTSWLVSLNTNLLIPKHLCQYINQKMKDDELHLSDISRGNARNFAADLMRWTIKILKQVIGENSGTSKEKAEHRNFIYSVYDIFGLLTTWGIPKEIISEIRGSDTDKVFKIAYKILNPPSFMRKIDYINTISDLQEYQSQQRKKNQRKGYITVCHESVKDSKITVDELNTAWFNEVRLLAVHHQSVAKIKKLKIPKFKRNKMRNILELVLFSSISEKLNVAYDQLPNSTYRLWMSSRKYLRLLHITSKYHADLLNCLYKMPLKKALDMHFLLSQFNLVSNTLNNLEINISIQPPDFAQIISNSVKEIEAATSRLQSWKLMVLPEIRNIENNSKRKWNMKWKINSQRAGRKYR